jgi:oligogalacturonide lyase
VNPPHMKARAILAALLCGALLPAIEAQRPASTVRPGATPSDPSWKPGSPPPKSWIDPATGHRVVRLTDEPNSESFYFNVNAYTPDGRAMAYTARDGIDVIDLKTWKTRQVVKGHVFAIQVGFRTSSVFYVQFEGEPPAPGNPAGLASAKRALYETNIDTGVTRKLVDLPPRAMVSTINADETLAAGTYVEGAAGEPTAGPPPGAGSETRQTSPGLQPLNKGAMMERRLAAHLPMVLFVIDLRTGRMRPLLHSTDWINHLLFSPTDPGLLMYCHEGPWQKVDRIWTIHTDGTHNTLIHKRTMFMEIFGHEFWGHDGRTLWYDWQTPKGEDFWLASYNMDTGRRTAYHMERNEWGIHFNVSRDESLFCDDGGDPGQVARAQDGEWIELLHPQRMEGDGLNEPGFVQPGVFHAERLVNMSTHNYRLEPNVSFTPDMQWIVFRSNMFGPTYVFAVEVARAGTR